MSEISIRTARPSDAEAVTRVLRAAYAPWQDRLTDLPDVTGGVAGEIATGDAWVAVAGNGLVGAVLAHRHEDTLHIANLGVVPEASGRGVATALMREATQHAVATNVTLMRLATHKHMTGNVPFYERLGWSVTAIKGNKVLMERAV